MNFQYLLKIRDIKNIRGIKLDFYFQTLVFISTPILTMLSSRPGEWVLGVLVAQFVLGLWQMSSSLLSIVFRTPAFKRKLRHFILSLLYLAIFFLVLTLDAASDLFVRVDLTTIVTAICFFGPAWVLGIYYYSITWGLAYPRHKKLSNFLPHINF